MRQEGDPRVLAVLRCALMSNSRSTRLRAVAMLARVECRSRERWLQRACGDSDVSVRQTAAAVCSWVRTVEDAPWPAREELPLVERGRDGLNPAPDRATLEGTRRPGWRWEYTVEVWRGDGLLVGVFPSTSFGEDDEHAKRIALGQAVLASATPSGDAFDPSAAAAFIVGKRQTPIVGAAESDA